MWEKLHLVFEKLLINYIIFFAVVGGILAVIWYFMGVESGQNKPIEPKQIDEFIKTNKITNFFGRHLITISMICFILAGTMTITITILNGKFHEAIYYPQTEEYDSIRVLKEADYSGGPTILLGVILLIIGLFLVYVKLSSKNHK
jgi:hypothetical protein